MRLLREITGDVESLSRVFGAGKSGARKFAETLSYDGSQVLLLSRMRQAAGRHGVPVFGSLARRLQTSLFGIEISRDAQLGEGVVFLHTVGVVIGGDSRIGDRVIFLGGNTVGTINNTGYPRIGNDVVVGAGARILGPVTIGDGASIGANAVVLCNVPAGTVALGVPAVVRSRRDPGNSEHAEP